MRSYRTRNTWVMTVALLAIVAISCNVVQRRQAHIEDGLREAGFERRVERLGDAEVEVWVGGRGPDLLLLHGFGASAVWQWADQMAAYVHDYRVIVPNLLWFGSSHSRNRDFSVDHQRQVVLSLLDRLGSKQTNVVGLSYGGFVTFELAALHPERVNKIVISDSPGRAFRLEDYQAICKRLGVEKLSELLVPADKAGVDYLMELGYFSPPWAPGFAKRQVVETLYSKAPDEQRALLDTMVDDWPKDDGSTPEAPALLIWGQSDTLFSLNLAERLRERLGSNARLETIQNARHAPNLEHPEKFNQLVLDFLEDN